MPTNPNMRILVVDDFSRITSYNVCYTKLLRALGIIPVIAVCGAAGLAVTFVAPLVAAA